MNTMGKYVIFLIFWSSCISLTAQQPAQMEFVKTVCDFGTFSEDDEPRSHEFVFTNKGRSALLVYGVATTCGCTVAAFSREPVLPGRQGKIVLTYHPKGRPGRFDRQVMVKSNAVDSDSLLRITGEVVPGKVEKYPGFRSKIGGLKLKTHTVRLGMVYKGRPYEQRVVVVNDGQESLGVEFENVPSYLRTSLEPEVLRPGQEGEIVIDYRVPLGEDWGMREDFFYIRPSGYGKLSGDGNRFVIYADWWDDPGLRDQEKDVPKVVVYPQVVDLGAIGGNWEMMRTIRLTNKGQADLIVRRVYCPLPAVSFVLPEKKAVLREQSVEIGVRVDIDRLPEGFSGTQLYISTNDPDRQTIQIPIKTAGK